MGSTQSLVFLKGNQLSIVKVGDWTGRLGMLAASGTLDRIISYKPSLAASYQPVGTSYQPMDSSYETMGDEGVMQVFFDVYQ